MTKPRELSSPWGTLPWHVTQGTPPRENMHTFSHKHTARACSHMHSHTQYAHTHCYTCPCTLMCTPHNTGGHLHTYVRRYIFPRRIHIHTLSQAHAYRYMHLHWYMLTHSLAHSHICTHSRSRVHALTRLTHTHTCSHTPSYCHPYTHALTYRMLNPHTHTHTHAAIAQAPPLPACQLIPPEPPRPGLV